MAEAKEFPAACFNGGSVDIRSVGALVPGWHERYLAMTVSLDRAPEGRSRPLRVASKTGRAGLDQAVVLPRQSFTVQIEGRAVAGAALLAVGYSEGKETKEETRLLTLKGGRQTERFRLPPGQGAVTVLVGVITGVAGTLELNSVRLFVGGQKRQLLRNPGLMAEACPVVPPRPEAANSLPGWFRIFVTGFLLVLIGLGIFKVGRAVARRA